MAKCEDHNTILSNKESMFTTLATNDAAYHAPVVTISSAFKTHGVCKQSLSFECTSAALVQQYSDVSNSFEVRAKGRLILPKGTPYIECILPKGPYPPCLLMTDTALSAGYTRHIVLLTLRLRTVSESDSDWCWLHWLLLSDKETNADIHEIFKSQIWVPEFNSISSVTTGRLFDGICLRQ